MSHYHPSQPGQYRAPTQPPSPPKRRVPVWAWVLVAVLALPALLIGGCTAVLAAGSLATEAADKAPVISTQTPTYDPGIQTPPTQRPVETATVPVKQRTAVFLFTVRQEYPELAGVADDTLIGLAQAACRVLESGGTKTDVFRGLMDDYKSAEALAYTIGAGVAVFCPKYAGVFA